MDNRAADRRTVTHSDLSPSQRTQRARIAATVRWSKSDAVEGTEAARSAFLQRFVTQVDPHGRLDPVERTRRAEAAKRAYFQQMAFRRHRAS